MPGGAADAEPGTRERQRVVATSRPTEAFGLTMGPERAGFRMILEAQPDIEVVAEAADGLEAVATAERVRPDVILMDIRMPNLDGVEATRRLTGHRVLILTTFNLDE